MHRPNIRTAFVFASMILALILLPTMSQAVESDEAPQPTSSTLRKKAQAYLLRHVKLPRSFLEKLKNLRKFSKSEALEELDLDRRIELIESGLDHTPDAEISREVEKLGMSEKSPFTRWLLKKMLHSTARTIKEMSDEDFKQLIEDGLAEASRIPAADGSYIQFDGEGNGRSFTAQDCPGLLVLILIFMGPADWFLILFGCGGAI